LIIYNNTASQSFTHLIMARFEVKQSAKLNLTSYSGLALIGQCCQAAQVDAVIDPCLPVSQGMRASDVVKSMVGLLSLGKSDFEAIEPFRSDRFFKEALGLSKVPGSVWIRQRLDAKAAELRELTDELSLRLLERTEAPITAHQGYVCADLDTFVMDNSDTRKEAVSRTYQGIDGYTPIALYLGNEGWNIGLELRAGSHHSALETDFFLERTFPRLERLCPKDAHVLWRDDSGFDSARLLFAKAGERDRWMALGRSFDFITKWNPRKQDKEAWVAKAEVAGSFTETRPGKRVGAARPDGRAGPGRRRSAVSVWWYGSLNGQSTKRGNPCWCRTSNCRAGGPASTSSRKRSLNCTSTTARMSSSTRRSRPISIWSDCPRASSTPTIACCTWRRSRTTACASWANWG
jgi:hypothetical protein